MNRRNFFKTLFGAAAAIVVAPLVPEKKHVTVRPDGIHPPFQPYYSRKFVDVLGANVSYNYRFTVSPSPDATQRIRLIRSEL